MGNTSKENAARPGAALSDSQSVSDESYHISNDSDRSSSRDASTSETQQAGADNVVPLPPARDTSKLRSYFEEELEAEHDENWPFVPPGEYTVAFVKDEKISIWKRSVWVVSMQIIDLGVHIGIVLPYYLNALPKGKRPTPGWYISSAFDKGTGRKPPKDLWRRRPRSFLADCIFRARVRSIKKDSLGVERSEGAYTSRVECLLERITGTPPCLGGEKG